MKKLVIAEKSSVGRDLAIYLKCFEDKHTHFENDEYVITWARGHLIRLASPDVYGFDYSLQTLPMIPHKFLTEVEPSTEKQFNIITELIGKCSEIIVATDAGREGELIFRYIYDYSKSKKPFKRLWLQSLTNEGIKEAFATMKDGKEYDNLANSGYSRAKSDWLLGMNLTRALTLTNTTSKQISAGRVKSPTLCIISKRYQDNKNFKTTNFFYPVVEIYSDNNLKIQFKADQQFNSQEESDKVVQKITILTCEAYTKGQAFEQTPLLLSLNDLQIEASKRYGYSPTETLEFAQKLYEKQYITYPRTDSRYLTEDMTTQVLRVITGMKNCNNTKILEQSKVITYDTVENIEDHKVFDNSQVSDHYGIIPLYKYDKLDHHEGIVFNLIVERFLKAFSEDAVFTTVKATFKSADMSFNYNSRILLKEGFKAINLITHTQEDKEDAEIIEKNILDFTIQKDYPVQSVITAKVTTAPLKLHTIASLLTIMDNPKNLLETELYKPKNKGFSLGTPATRASIIEQLIEKDKTVEVKGKSLIPTEFGLSVYEVIKGYDFSKTDLTAEWEFKLQKIAEGLYSNQAFDNEIVESIKNIIDVLKKTKISISESGAINCPKCKKGVLIDKGIFYACSERSESSCDFSFSKEKGGVAINIDTIKEILSNGKTKKRQVFKSKDGKAFEANLIFDIDFKLNYSFNESIGVCPKCEKGELNLLNKWLNCSTENCTKLHAEQFGKQLSSKELACLLKNNKIALDGFFSQKTQKNFSATLILFEEQGKIKTKLEFPKK